MRFYNIDWGQGYHFHPDEYHIVIAVGKLIRSGLFTDPELYSYGSLSVYLIYFVQKLVAQFSSNPFPDIFIIGRLLAAFFSTLTLINIYLIAGYFFPKNKMYSALTALTAAFVPGLIQQAHFLTPESFMTFWITLSTYFFIKHFEKTEIKYLLFSAISLGLAGGTKISSFAVLPFFLLFLIFTGIKKRKFVHNLQKTIIYVITILIFFFLSFPYSLISYEKLINTTRYESSLSAGTLKVFYTRAFEGTQPFVFQLKDIYPYTLGIVLCIFSFAGFFLSIHTIFKKAASDKIPYLILTGTFLSFFIFNSLLFTKWTRFVHPTFPFLVIFALIAAGKISLLLKNSPTGKYFAVLITTILLLSTILWGGAFFSIYKKDDVRVEATNWVNENIPKNSDILTETGNTLEVPLWGGYNIIPFDFYNLDRDPRLVNKLAQNIALSDYFIIQSRRIYLNHKLKYPYVYNFYNALFSGDLGFKEISVFNSFPNLSLGGKNFNFPDETAEETWSVFDHPTVRVFEKTNTYPEEYYKILLNR